MSRGCIVFELGMVIFNEFGFYCIDYYGICIENFIFCVVNEIIDYGEFFCFEDLIFFLID